MFSKFIIRGQLISQDKDRLYMYYMYLIFTIVA